MDRLEGDELVRLCCLARGGDVPARNRVVEAYGSLAMGIARRLTSARGRCWSAFAVEDLCQEGAVGLMYAAVTWDPARGTFCSYASLCCRHSMYRAIEATKRHRVPAGWDVGQDEPAPDRMGPTESDDALYEGLSRLDAVDRELLVMRHGLETGEMASLGVVGARVGLTRQAAYKVVWLAERRLAEAMAN